MTTKIVFLDTETTGLDPKRHQVWEVAYSTGLDKPVEVFQVWHSLTNADPAALRINGYLDRVNENYVKTDEEMARHRNGHSLLPYTFTQGALWDAYVIGSNPAFDTSFLREALGFAPWKHRLIDLSNIAMAKFSTPVPMGMKEVRDRLTEMGYDIPEPDHTAKRDVETLKACYEILTSRDWK